MFKKFNYLKHNSANRNVIQPCKIKAQHGNFKVSYTSALKKNINKKPLVNNDTNRTSEKPTLQQQLKSLIGKQIRSSGSRSPFRKQSKQI